MRRCLERASCRRCVLLTQLQCNNNNNCNNATTVPAWYLVVEVSPAEIYRDKLRTESEARRITIDLCIVMCVPCAFAGVSRYPGAACPWCNHPTAGTHASICTAFDSSLSLSFSGSLWLLLRLLVLILLRL
jgi:hypothetical protein